MIVVLTDGRANISLKRSTDPEAAAAEAPRPSAQELKVNFSVHVAFYELKSRQLIMTCLSDDGTYCFRPLVKTIHNFPKKRRINNVSDVQENSLKI